MPLTRPRRKNGRIILNQEVMERTNPRISLHYLTMLDFTYLGSKMEEHSRMWKPESKKPEEHLLD
jgi:hypothetical protein